MHIRDGDGSLALAVTSRLLVVVVVVLTVVSTQPLAAVIAIGGLGMVKRGARRRVLAVTVLVVVILVRLWLVLHHDGSLSRTLLHRSILGRLPCGGH